MSENEFDETIPEKSEQLDQLQPDDTLIDRGVDDVLDEGYITADRWRGPDEGASIDERLRDEEPDVDAAVEAADGQGAEILDDDEVGADRAGRIADAPTDAGRDVEADLVGDDVGISGGAASAEEAAVHVVDDIDDPDDLPH